MANLIDEKNINRINLKNLSDLKSVSIERKFGRPEDYIEVSILDLNNRLLSYIPNLTSYSKSLPFFLQYSILLPFNNLN